MPFLPTSEVMISLNSHDFIRHDRSIFLPNPKRQKKVLNFEVPNICASVLYHKQLNKTINFYILKMNAKINIKGRIKMMKYFRCSFIEHKLSVLHHCIARAKK